jgi:hypothetical protein
MNCRTRTGRRRLPPSPTWRPSLEQLEARVLMAADKDDQISEAIVVAVGGWKDGTISAATDVDMYKFSAAPRQAIGIDVDRTSSSSRLDSYLRIFDADGNELAHNDDANAPGESASSPRESYLSYTFAAGGTYYAGISGHGNKAYSARSGSGDKKGSTGAFTLRLTDLNPPLPPPVPSGDDPDDQLFEAQRVKPTSELIESLDNGVISTETDVDLYQFTADFEGITFDVVRSAGSLLIPLLRLFNADGAEIPIRPLQPPAEGTDSIHFVFHSPGTHFIGVSGMGNSAYNPVSGEGDLPGSTGGYSLRIASHGAPAAPFEGTPVYRSDTNDQLYEASRIPIGGTVSQDIAAANSWGAQPGPDTDMYKFSAAAGQRVGFDLDRAANSTLNGYLRVFDVTGAELAANDDAAAPGEMAGTESYIEYTFAIAGTFYVGVSSSASKTYNAVTGAGNVSGSVGGYTLTLSAR